MNMHLTLIRMLKQLLEEMMVLHQQGAGYYSCIPIIRRYNKLLGQARTLMAGEPAIIGTFDDLEERDPKDPSDKMTVIQGIRVEIGQLIALLDSDLKANTQGGASS